MRDIALKKVDEIASYLKSSVQNGEQQLLDGVMKMHKRLLGYMIYITILLHQCFKNKIYIIFLKFNFCIANRPRNQFLQFQRYLFIFNCGKEMGLFRRAFCLFQLKFALILFYCCTRSWKLNNLPFLPNIIKDVLSGDIIDFICFIAYLSLLCQVLFIVLGPMQILQSVIASLGEL